MPRHAAHSPPPAMCSLSTRVASRARRSNSPLVPSTRLGPVLVARVMLTAPGLGRGVSLSVPPPSPSNTGRSTPRGGYSPFTRCADGLLTGAIPGTLPAVIGPDPGPWNGGRVANGGRYCRGCGSRLARDNTATHCTACARRMSAAAGAPPAVRRDFWDSAVMRVALASRHIGRVIRAYRYHPHHGGRPLPQQRVGGWLGLTQAQLSRVENGPAVTDLTRLTAWAGTLAIPADRLWFHLPGQSEPTDQADAHGAYAAPRSTTSPARVRDRKSVV